MGLLIGLVLTIVSCFSLAYAAPPFWTQGRQISLGSAISSEADACSREEEIYVVWSDNRTGNREIFFIRSLDAGYTWSNEERITDTPGESVQPAIAYDKKNLYLTWREKTEDVSQIYFKKWDGKVWGDNLLLSGTYKDSQRPDIACTTVFPGSYIYAVWDSGEDAKALLTRSIDGGRSFSSPQPITSGNWSTREPVVWGGARDAYIAWVDNREGDWNIYLKRWGEVQVGSDTKLSTQPDCHSPAISGIEPEIYVAWQCTPKDKVYAEIYFASYGVRAERLTDGKAESVFPKVIVSDRTPWVFWQDGRNGEWQLFFQQQASSIQHPASSIQTLTDANQPDTLLDVATTPGQIHVFWTRSESSSRANVMYIRRDTIAPRRPGTPSHLDLTAVSGYDDDNQITFSWEAPEHSRSGEIAKYNVYFKVNNGDFKLIGSTENTSYDVPGENEKTYQVYVEAVDEVGNISTPSGFSPKVICDSQPPEVAIYSPYSDSIIRGDIPVILSVNDPNLLEYIVEYGITPAPAAWWRLAGPFQKEADRERIMTWETSALSGIYTLRVSARDKAGNESRAKTTVNIDSRPPVIISPGKVTQLTEPDIGWTYGAPAWSPDGDRIAFCSDEGGTEDIWTISPDGSSPKRLTRSISVDRNPAWSQSGNMLAFQSFTEDGLWDIWVIKADGKDAKKIIYDKSSDENPVWSPDGTSIAFDSDRDGDSEIFLITNVQDVLKGAAPLLFQLTDNEWEDKNPTWSPDGSRIVFQSNRRGNWDLFETGIDGQNTNVILATNADEMEPEWSPDRKRLLFSTNQSGDHYEIYSIDWPGTTGQTRLSENARHGSWSPAMDSIAYESDGSLYFAELVHPIGNLEAVISYPRGGEALKGAVDVKGIACGNDFYTYKLQYCECGDQKLFQTVGGESTSPVYKTGFLGKWYTEGLEGEYLLKLTVTGKDGSYVEDSVRVLIANQLPFVLVDEPQEGLTTDKTVITVNGCTGQRVMLTINNSEIYPNPYGRFSRDIQLTEGSNTIVIKAKSLTEQGGEYTVQRTVFLDTKPPVITLESPGDFQIINVPYITVKGSLDEKAEVSILSSRVWTDESNSFQRKILCSEGTNLIRVIAFDKLGHYASVTRRVIFQKKDDISSDTFAPAVTDVFPDNNAVVTGRDLQLSATFVDDVGLNPLKFTFSFDNVEVPIVELWKSSIKSALIPAYAGIPKLEEYTLDIEIPKEGEEFPLDQYPVIHFTYRPTPPVPQGIHRFKIGIQDTSGNTSGNTSESSFKFIVDSFPTKVLVSALPIDSTDQIEVTAVSNKSLVRISKGDIYTTRVRDILSASGYSLPEFEPKDGYYKSLLDISPSQQNFVIDLAAETYLGEVVSVQGFMAWCEARPGERISLGFEGGPQLSSTQIKRVTKAFILVLQSQDGFNKDDLRLQQEDAERRRLRNSGLVYVLRAPEEIKEGDLQGILSLPITDASIRQHLVMFRWDEDLEQWQPLEMDRLSEASVESQITGPGVYTLFEDFNPPVIKDVYPVDMGDVPLDKFFVEASILDSGSGISQIKLTIDGSQVSYDYDPNQGRLVYFPSSLEWGMHKMEIIATDRAGNVAIFSTRFVTQEIFRFISVRAYPNPARGDVNIEFKLTRLADVNLRIYTITGDLVYSTEEKNMAIGTFKWKLQNSSGSKVASGVYIYLMEASLYDTKIREKGRIAVLR